MCQEILLFFQPNTFLLVAVPHGDETVSGVYCLVSNVVTDHPADMQLSRQIDVQDNGEYQKYVYGCSECGNHCGFLLWFADHVTTLILVVQDLTSYRESLDLDVVLCPFFSGDTWITGPDHNEGNKVDFQSSYPCPVAIRRSGGNGRQGLCAMELLDVMTREANPDLNEKYLLISDNEGGVNSVLRSAVLWWNDFGSEVLTQNQRADIIWPILPSVLGTASISINPVAFGDHLQDLGYGEFCCALCPFTFHPLVRDTNSKHDPEKATEVLKSVIRMFYAIANVSPPQSDYSGSQIANLQEWMEWTEGITHLRDNGWGTKPIFPPPPPFSMYVDEEEVNVSAT